LGAGKATATTFGLGARLVNVERATSEVGAIQSRNCPIRLGRIRHLDESETARAPSVTIRHQAHTIHRTVRLEKRSHRRFSSGKIQIAYEDVFHVFTPSIFQLCELRRQIEFRKEEVSKATPIISFQAIPQVLCGPSVAIANKAVVYAERRTALPRPGE
jgi:hypothetical protein